MTPHGLADEENEENSGRQTTNSDEKNEGDGIAKSKEGKNHRTGDDVDSLLHSAINIHQLILFDAERLQSDPKHFSTTLMGVPSHPRLDNAAKRIQTNAMKSGELLHRARRRIKEQRPGT